MGGDWEACSTEVKRASTDALVSPQATLDRSSPIPPAPADWAARVQLHVAQGGVGSSGLASPRCFNYGRLARHVTSFKRFQFGQKWEAQDDLWEGNDLKAQN